MIVQYITVFLFIIVWKHTQRHKYNKFEKKYIHISKLFWYGDIKVVQNECL